MCRVRCVSYLVRPPHGRAAGSTPERPCLRPPVRRIRACRKYRTGPVRVASESPVAESVTGRCAAMRLPYGRSRLGSRVAPRLSVATQARVVLYFNIRLNATRHTHGARERTQQRTYVRGGARSPRFASSRPPPVACACPMGPGLHL
jgi:hypothetical protein